MKTFRTLKIICVVLTFVTLCAALSSCSASDVPDGMKSVSPAAAAFSLYVPKGWYDNSACGTASATYSSSDRSNVSMTAMLADSEYTTLDEYMVYADKSLKEAIPTYEILPSAKTAALTESSAIDSSAVESSSVDSSSVDSSALESCEENSSAVSDIVAYAVTEKKLGGVSAYSFCYKASLDGKNYKFMQVFCIRGGTFYIFTYSAEESLYDSHLDDVNSILENIRFK